MTRPGAARGVTLIELMVALTVLAIGILGLTKMHVIGIFSNGGARMNMQASALAQELAQGLERLSPNDPLVALTAGTSATPPAGFGHLVDGGGTFTVGTARAWDDSYNIPGVRANSQIPTGYDRHWSIWGYSPTGGDYGSAVIAVSVVWSEPAISRPREVVVYTQIARPSTLMSGILANE